MVECLNQSDAADLKQIVHIFAAMMEPLEHAEHKPQIAPDELLPRLHIPCRMRSLLMTGSVDVSTPQISTLPMAMLSPPLPFYVAL